MKTQVVNRTHFVLILATALMVFGIQRASYGQTITASVQQPLTEANLHDSIVTLTLSSGIYESRIFDLEPAVNVSGIPGVTIGTWQGIKRFGIERVSDTLLTIQLQFSGNIDTNTPLVFTVGAGAIVEYNGNALTATVPVTAVEESLEASAESPLTEANLDGSIITLALTGRRFDDTEGVIGYAMSFSGIEGVTVSRYGVNRVSDTKVTVKLAFFGNIDTDATLTLTVGPDAIVGGYDKAFTFQFPVTAIEESLDVSMEAPLPLTEAVLHGNIVTLTLTGRRFADSEWDIARAVSFSGIEGVTVSRYTGVDRVSDTKVTFELAFFGNIDTDATLTLTVGSDAMVGGGYAFTFQFPVTAVKESLVVSTEFPLMEATLDGSIITLTLTGRRFADAWTIRDAVSVSGINGVTVARYVSSYYGGGVYRASDTEVAIPLEFDGTDFDTDATLTFTVGADAIEGYNPGPATQFPVTAIEQSNATVSISPLLVVSPDVGEQLTLSLNIAGGENVTGYQATALFENSLYHVKSVSGDYLPANTFFLADESFREVTLTANTLAGAANGDGTLATLTFRVRDFKPSMVILSQVYLVDADGKRWEAATQNGTVTVPPEPAAPILGDINRDGVVNMQDLAIVNARLGQRGQNSADVNADGLVDIVDLVLVAGAFDAEAAAPSAQPQVLELFTAADVRRWLAQAQGRHSTDATFQSGIHFLEQLLIALAPKATTLLPNYPNPFNPETWIPYRLAEDAFVTLTIYDGEGRIVRTLDVGHRSAAFYESRSKAIYWDGRNEFGEQVGSGVYFYHLSAGNYSATRKMLIVK